MKKKVIISACLLGEYCRYDGKTKKADEIVEAFREYEIIPFCPEAPLFGTPRERISIVEINSERRVITDDTKRDVTKLLENVITDFVKSNPHVDEIILKSKSPSCGLGTTPILNSKREIVTYGDGIAAKIFKTHYSDIDIKDDTFVVKLEKVML